METYFISDLHIWHGNICKYCNRPYNISDNIIEKNYGELLRMRNDILELFDALPNECTIYILGDVWFPGALKTGKLSNLDLANDVKRIKNKSRKVYLILGNHDTLGGNDVIKYYYTLGFDRVYDAPIIFNKKLILSHEPVFISPTSNFKNIHGHTHIIDVNDEYFCYDHSNIRKPPSVRLENKVNSKNYFNVSYDRHKKIFSLSEILDFYEKY